MIKYDVYGIGNALLDTIFSVDEAFLDDASVKKGTMTLIDRVTHDKLFEKAVNAKCAAGGSVANAMIIISLLGGKGFLSCKVADDEAGRCYLNDIHSSGLNSNLDTGRLTVGVTGKCLVMITPDAERTMCTYLGATETISISELDPAAIARSRYLYIEGYLVAQKTGVLAAVECARIARENNVKVALTFSDINMISYFRKEMDQIIGDGLDLLFCNEKEAMEYTQKRNLDSAFDGIKRMSKAFVITRGAEGAVIYDGSRRIDLDGKKVNAIDTVGAGDMFAGTFLYAITHGFDYKGAGILANLAASQVVTQYGPRLTRSQSEGILKKSLEL